MVPVVIATIKAAAATTVLEIIAATARAVEEAVV